MPLRNSWGDVAEKWRPIWPCFASIGGVELLKTKSVKVDHQKYGDKLNSDDNDIFLGTCQKGKSPCSYKINYNCILSLCKHHDDQIFEYLPNILYVDLIYLKIMKIDTICNNAMNS